MNKRGIIQLLTSVTLLIIVTNFILSSSLSVFSDKYLVVGLYPLSVVDAELDAKQLDLSLRYAGKHSLTKTLQVWQEAFEEQILPRDEKTGLLLVEKDGITYYPPLEDALEKVGAYMNEYLEQYRKAYNQRNVGHTQNTDRPGSTVVPLEPGSSIRDASEREGTSTIYFSPAQLQEIYSNGKVPGGRSLYSIPQNNYAIGYKPGYLILVPDHPFIFGIAQPFPKGEFGQAVRRSDTGWNGWYIHQENIDIPISDKDAKKIYPFFELQEQFNRAYLCMYHSLSVDLTPAQTSQNIGFCERISSTKIEFNYESEISIANEKFVAYKNLACDPEFVPEPTNEFSQVTIAYNENEKEIMDLAFFTNQIQYFESDRTSDKDIYFKFGKVSTTNIHDNTQPRWWYKIGSAGTWRILAAIDPELQGKTNDPRNQLRDLILLEQFSFENGLALFAQKLDTLPNSGVYGSLRRAFVGENKFVITENNNVVMEFYRADSPTVNEIAVAMKTVAFNRDSEQYNNLIQRKQEILEDIDAILFNPAQCTWYKVEVLTPTEQAYLETEQFLTFIAQSNADFYALLDRNQDGTVTNGEAMRMLDEYKQGNFPRSQLIVTQFLDIVHQYTEQNKLEQRKAELLNEEQYAWLSHSQYSRNSVIDFFAQNNIPTEQFDRNNDGIFDMNEILELLLTVSKGQWPGILQTFEIPLEDRGGSYD